MKYRIRRGGAAAMGVISVPVLIGLVGATMSGDSGQLPSLKGDLDKGKLSASLYRGGSVPDELLVIATPNNCQNHLDVNIEWDEAENYVRVHLKGKNVFDPSPVIQRTEGVDYLPNRWWPEAKDVTNGRYLLWLITVPRLINFYYDPETLDLMGSEFDFETPPPAITIPIPAFVAVPTDFIEVKPNGDVDYTHTFEYDGLKRGDLPQFTHFWASFIPHSLCTANPFDYTQTSSRPYAGPTLPASEALPFSEYLRNGLIFDITVEPEDYHIFPPISTNIATYSQSLAVAGGIPEGWTNDLEAVFANLAPPIKPWEAAGTCEDWFKPKRDRDFNICVPPAAEGGE
jgi:hypothetical protein